MVNETNEEQVSALVDGELQDSELRHALDAVQGDPSLTDRWTRYHLISDALRNNLADQVPLDAHRRVREALDAEPVVFAPKRRNVTLPPLLRQAAGLAVAASVTAIAILGVQSMNGEDSATDDRQVVAQRPAKADRPEGGEVPAGAHGLDAYVLNHNEYSASTGMQGALPYVRIVSHETAR